MPAGRTREENNQQWMGVKSAERNNIKEIKFTNSKEIEFIIVTKKKKTPLF